MFYSILSHISPLSFLGSYLLNTVLLFQLSFNSSIEYCDFPEVISNTIHNRSILTNFHIKPNHPDRIYFDSEKLINGSSAVGFKINNDAIFDAHINEGNFKNHYFKLTKPLSYWDNVLIRYEKGSDIKDLAGNSLGKVPLSYVMNFIAEPGAVNDIYVNVNYGDDENHGLTEEDALKSISKAAQLAKAGTTVWIKSGIYPEDDIEIVNDGNSLNPIKFIGYNDRKVGLGPSEKSLGMDFDGSIFPLIKGNSQSAIKCTSRKYIIFENIQIDGGFEYGFLLNKSKYVTIKNSFLRNLKVGIRNIDKNGLNIRVIDSYVENCEKVAIRLDNRCNLISNTIAVSTRDVGMDYYLSIYGGVNGGFNIIRNCKVERFEKDSHTGHGISLKGGRTGNKLIFNLIENCSIDGPRGGLEFRHSGVSYSVARNIYFSNKSKNKNAGAIKFQDGAHNNWVEYCRVKDVSIGIRLKNSGEDAKGVNAGFNNYVVNSIFENCNSWLIADSGVSGSGFKFVNNTIYNCPGFMKITIDLDDSNLFANNIVVGSKRYFPGSSKMRFENNNFWNNGFESLLTGNNYFFDPEFIEVSRNNYKLSETSPCIDVGLAFKEITNDIDGVKRPQGKGYDIGAYETRYVRNNN